ncbi:monocarboxylate transporter 14-like [Ruditapes philippinarum]|uniref:monocarboxylate transporter 14-like n=1 Tax=Ruditapes philippinarum TaxID=129788 RepID=UPI00295BE22F|nr:monocarboxylate transporter 14-like [Ruditapes philippinarum]
MVFVNYIITLYQKEDIAARAVCTKMESEKSNILRRIHKWLVFFSAYYVMVVNVGFYYSFGTLFPDIMTEFGSSRAETAVIQSTLIAVGLGSGLLNGVIIHKYGLVKAGLYGSVVSCVGVMACYFATSVAYMIISIGILMAVGFSCMFISSSTAIVQHFKGKQRLLMLSLQGSGAGLGGMIYPYLLRYLSSQYGIRGNLLVISAIFMNSIPICFLWGQPDDTDGQQSIPDQSKSDETFDNEHCGKIFDDTNGFEKDNSENEKLMNGMNSHDAIPSKQAVISEEHIDFNDKNDTKDDHVKKPFHETDSISKSMTDSNIDIVIENQSKNHCGESADTLCHSLSQILKNRTFVIYLLGGVTSYPALGLMMVFVVDIFLDKDFTSEDAAFGQLLLSALNILGRFLPGILMQFRCVSTLSIPMLASLISTTVFPCLVLARVKWLATLLCAFTGLSLGMFVSIYSVTTVKLVGQERLPNAMGLLFSANSLGNAIAGPVCGYLRDITGSYSIPLYAGAVMSLSGFICYTTASITRRRTKH